MSQYQDQMSLVANITGECSEVGKILAENQIYAEEKIGGMKGAMILKPEGEELVYFEQVTIQSTTLEKLFSALCGKETTHEHI